MMGNSRPPRWGRLGVVAAVLASTANPQIYRVEPVVVPASGIATLHRVLTAVSEQPGTLVLLADPAAGIVTTASVLAGIELEQSALQQMPRGAALAHTGLFVRANGPESSEVYARSSLLITREGREQVHLLASTGRPEAQLLTVLKTLSERTAGARRSRTFSIPARAVWRAIQQLRVEGHIVVRFFSPDLGVATIYSQGERELLAGTLFVEEVSPAESRVRANAVLLSMPGCVPMQPGKTSAEVALLELIAAPGATEPAATPASEPEGFCRLLVERPRSTPLDRLRERAIKRSFPEGAEALWSAVLLLVRQFPAVTASDKNHWRIQYDSACSQDVRPRNLTAGELAGPRPACRTSIWLEPGGSATDLFVAPEEAGQDSEASRGEVETLLDKIATQLEAEKKLRYLAQGSAEFL